MSTTVIVLIIAAVAVIALVIATRKPALPSAGDADLDGLPPGTPEAAKDDTKAAPTDAPPSAEAAASEGQRDTAITVMPDESDLASDPGAGPPSRTPGKRNEDIVRLRKGLSKVRATEGLFGRLKTLLGGKKEIAPDLVEEIEEILLTSDVGVKTTEMLLSDLRDGLEKKALGDPDKVWAALRARAVELLDQPRGGALRDHGSPTVALMVGVNGTGKTTTIGKIATQLTAKDKKVLLVAGDTFRAAAVAQLQAWGKRVGCDVYAGDDNADPASVVFDAIKEGIDDGVDFILVDTAGRLHTKSNLMDELKKIVRTTGKALDGAPHETLLVVDGTTGQNAIQQAQMFGEALKLDGIVLTKLDGTAKGGVVIAIAAEHQLPVRYVGVGERADDLREFKATEFAEAMLGHGDESAEAA